MLQNKFIEQRDNLFFFHFLVTNNIDKMMPSNRQLSVTNLQNQLRQHTNNVNRVDQQVVMDFSPIQVPQSSSQVSERSNESTSIGNSIRANRQCHTNKQVRNNANKCSPKRKDKKNGNVKSSFSHFVPKNLFKKFGLTSNQTTNSDKNGQRQQSSSELRIKQQKHQTKLNNNNNNNLLASKSFPISSNSTTEFALQRQSTLIMSSCDNQFHSQQFSVSGMTTQNNSNNKVRCSNPFLEDFSPMQICNSQTMSSQSSRASSNSAAKETPIKNSNKKKQDNDGNQQQQQHQKSKALRTTGKVLRDVKNSLGIRMPRRLKRGNKGTFAKLENEMTPQTTKMYSPFNVFTDSFNSDEKLSGENNDFQFADETPKRRVALQHKKHVSNKFMFDSPTGRFKDTVKDVENFQQCIENISQAIKTLDSKVSLAECDNEQF